MPDGHIPVDTSADQLVTCDKCPRKYLFRYVLGLEPELCVAPKALHASLRGAILWWFAERLAAGDPTVEQAETVFEADLSARFSAPGMRWDQYDPQAVLTHGKQLLRAYLTTHGRLRVVAVRQPFRVGVQDDEIGDDLPRALTGTFDLVLDDETVVKIMMARCRRNSRDLERSLHIGAYVAAKCELDGGPVNVTMHVVRTGETPAIEHHLVERGEPGNAWWVRAALNIEKGIAAGHFPPSRGPKCRLCAYARRCENWTESAGVSGREHSMAPAHVAMP